MKSDKSGELHIWQERLSLCQSAYSDDLELMERREALYAGTRDIIPSEGSNHAKRASNVRNIVAELVEAEVDSSVPQPKVMARHAKDQEKAKIIEDFIRNELDRLPFETMNDLDERTTPIQGGDMFLVEWDNSAGTHTTVGEVLVSLIHPKQVIPQRGVTNIADMDYIILRTACTKESLKRRYGEDLSNQSEESPETRGSGDILQSDEVVTLNTGYYKNNSGGIGRYRWVNDVELENLDDYEARLSRRCINCGAAWDGGTCPVCGCKTFRRHREDMEVLDHDVRKSGGVIIKKGTRLPFYSPKEFPIVIRKNVSLFGNLLGDSDVDKITDQQELIKKLGTKIEEKLLKGGSYVTFPRGASIRKTDEELKVIEINNASDKQLIDVLNIQPDVSRDIDFQDRAYQAAREIIGITDSYQGRFDPTALSGVAKKFAAEQSAGRMESKRVMKNAAYAEIFRLMFKLALAFADEPRPVIGGQNDGNTDYRAFDRYEFLEQDVAGQWYWNDNFLFSVDSSALPAGNRDQMWRETRENYVDGAFGDPSTTDAKVLYWTKMERLRYPDAAFTKKSMQQRLKAEEAEVENNETQSNGEGEM